MTCSLLHGINVYHTVTIDFYIIIFMVCSLLGVTLVPMLVLKQLELLTQNYLLLVFGPGHQQRYLMLTKHYIISI